jgi:hypothetical protein
VLSEEDQRWADLADRALIIAQLIAILAMAASGQSRCPSPKAW